MVMRSSNFEEVPLNIVGSSIFGRYPKISIEKTYNMIISDEFLVNYSGYAIAQNYLQMKGTVNSTGRGAFTSVKLNCMIIVIDNRVMRVTCGFNQQNLSLVYPQIIQIGTLNTTSGVVFFAENNKPQIAISDGVNIWIYDTTQLIPFQQAVTSFVPGYITFHDTYFICAAKQDPFQGVGVTNTWRLSAQNNGLSWPDASSNVGLLQTKSDNTQAVVRFPSKGNLIFVMGSSVTEGWFDTGAQLFPYQRNNQFNIDYGCLSPATVAYMDELVVWLASNEHSGAIIMYSNGGMPKKITTDGIDYLFAQMQNPADSQAFLYRQDGHMLYHINFYTDNLSLLYDFNTQKFFHVCDQNLNYFIASQLCFYQNQYFFVSRNSGNLYMMDTVFTAYQDTDKANNMPPNVIINEIPRFRTCKNIRLNSQEYFIANDAGFTIETGETKWQINSEGIIYIVTQNGQQIVTNGEVIFLLFQNGNYIVTQNGNYIVPQNSSTNVTQYLLIANQPGISYATPCVDLSISYDGGASFGEDMRYILNPIGGRRNKLSWWQLGASNDMVCQFKFWGIGRVAATNGYVNVRR